MVPSLRNVDALKRQFLTQVRELSFVPEGVKAVISRELIDEADLRSDACRRCGTQFASTTSRLGLSRQQTIDSIPKKKRQRSRTQLTVTCTRCCTTFDPVQLPRRHPSVKPQKKNTIPGANTLTASVTAQKSKQIELGKKSRNSAIKSKGLVLPKLTSRELKGKKTNRLSTLVAAMESTESSIPSHSGSSLSDFLSLL